MVMPLINLGKKSVDFWGHDFAGRRDVPRLIDATGVEEEGDLERRGDRRRRALPRLLVHT